MTICFNGHADPLPRLCVAFTRYGKPGLYCAHRENELAEDQFRHDQIVPIADSAVLSSKIIKNAKFIVYKGGSHGMCTAEKDRVNTDLLAFIKEAT